jgi:hypothetical protein
MATQYQIRLKRPTGEELTTLDRFESLEYALVENDVGALSLALAQPFPLEWFERDTRIEVWRSVDGARPYLEGGTQWLVRRRRLAINNANALTTLSAYDAKWLLKTRIVNYVSGSAQARKTAPLDDMMRAVVRENLGSLAVEEPGGITSRNLSAWLDVPSDVGLLASVSKAFAWDNVLTTMQALCNVSLELGTYASFDVSANPETNRFSFDVFTGARGVDRRESTGNGVILSLSNGSLSDLQVEDNFVDEKTFVKAGGQGEGAERALNYALDTARSTESPFNRVEDFYNATDTANPDLLLRDAQAQTSLGKPRRIVGATASQTSVLRYGFNYGFGDIVSLQVTPATIYDARLSRVHVRVSAQGEVIEPGIEISTVL